MRILLSIFIVLASLNANAAKGTTTFQSDHKDLTVVELHDWSVDKAFFTQLQKDWATSKRKLAQAGSFSEATLPVGFNEFRTQILKVKNAAELDVLMNTSYKQWSTYSPGMKYFYAQMHVMRALRGIVWRARPIFEEGKGFLGKKATHVAAVQMVRSTVNGIQMFFPTEQWLAGVEYVTEPSTDMTSSSQFHSIYDFQRYLSGELVPALKEAALRMESVLKSNPTSVYTWDNQVVYGTGKFLDNTNRYIGYGPAEVEFSIAAAYEGIHDALVFCAYNQDAILNVAEEIGKKFGIESSPVAGFFKTGALGLTDEERRAILSEATSKQHFLELRDYPVQGVTYGSDTMKVAFVALKNSVTHAASAYRLLQGKEANPAMVFNPIRYQPDSAQHLERGVMNMEAAIKGETEIRDPISGDRITINLPKYYTEPPKNLSQLMPVAGGFDKSGGQEKTIKAKNGETFTVRNYSYGRSIAWDNDVWSKYVPSAAGKPANYMADAKRVLVFSLGTASVFGAVNMFVH